MTKYMFFIRQQTGFGRYRRGVACTGTAQQAEQYIARQTLPDTFFTERVLVADYAYRGTTKSEIVRSCNNPPDCGWWQGD